MGRNLTEVAPFLLKFYPVSSDLFIESRSLIPADKETINAVRIDPVSIVRLKKYFFPEKDQKSDFQNELADAIIEESKTLEMPELLVPDVTAPVSEISQEEIKEVKIDLETNPPLKPDYKRLVEYYSSKFQYVKLRFDGAHLHSRKVEIPPDALPITDVELKKKLETKLNLFDKNVKDECFNSLYEFKDKVTQLRLNYLTKVKSRSESLLAKTRKVEFKQKLDDLRKAIQKVKSDSITKIAIQIEQTKERLQTDLYELIVANPKTLFPNHPDLWEGNQQYVEMQARSKTNHIVNEEIKWPEAHLLLDELKLIDQYSEITFEDLQNKQFIAELFECGLIDEADKDKLADYGKGIAI